MAGRWVSGCFRVVLGFRRRGGGLRAPGLSACFRVRLCDGSDGAFCAFHCGQEDEFFQGEAEFAGGGGEVCALFFAHEDGDGGYVGSGFGQAGSGGVADAGEFWLLFCEVCLQEVVAGDFEVVGYFFQYGAFRDAAFGEVA